MSKTPAVPQLPPDFAALDSAEQHRILVAGEQMTKFVFRHAAAVNVSPPPSVGGELHSGSGFVIERGGLSYLGTAWHVVERWLDLVGRGQNVLFQVRDALLDPRESIAWKDEDNDLVFLRLTEEERGQIGVAVCEAVRGWPPPHPSEGAYVLVSGFPAVVRKRETQQRVVFNALSTLTQVTSVGERHIVCQFTREHWVSFDMNGVPPHGTDLGGVSGGPVLLAEALSYPLVGAVSEFHPSFELLYIKTLSHVPSTFD